MPRESSVQLSARLADDLRRLYAADFRVPAGVDAAVMNAARARLAQVRRWRLLLRWGGGAAAAAAVVLVALQWWPGLAWPGAGAGERDRPGGGAVPRRPQPRRQGRYPRRLRVGPADQGRGADAAGVGHQRRRRGGPERRGRDRRRRRARRHHAGRGALRRRRESDQQMVAPSAALRWTMLALLALASSAAAWVARGQDVVEGTRDGAKPSAATGPASSPGAATDEMRFTWVNAYVDSGDQRLGAYQFEFAAEAGHAAGRVMVVGIVGGNTGRTRTRPITTPRRCLDRAGSSSPLTARTKFAQGQDAGGPHQSGGGGGGEGLQAAIRGEVDGRRQRRGQADPGDGDARPGRRRAGEIGRGALVGRGTGGRPVFDRSRMKKNHGRAARATTDRAAPPMESILLNKNVRLPAAAMKDCRTTE